VTDEQIRLTAGSLLSARDYLIEALATHARDTKTRRINNAIDSLMDAAEDVGYTLILKDDGK
jgi:hypothetical protein